jgi:hypothetical protein
MSETSTTFQGEMQLMNWGESSNSGAWVKLWINAEDLEHFRHLKTRTGKIAGHRMMTVMVEVDDNELPVPGQSPPAPKSKATLARNAAMICGSVDFQRYAKFRATYALGSDSPEEIAASLVRYHCGVKSRAELDTSDQAARLFQGLMSTYRAWLLRNPA